MRRIILTLLLLASGPLFAQSDTDILKAILSEYYKTEKVVVKGRMQYLFLYCGKANNNEQLFKTIDEMKLAKPVAAGLRKEILSDKAEESWTADLEPIFRVRPTLRNKVNTCLTLEQYHQEQKIRTTHNQRLMIVSKPLIYGKGKHALVKVEFYRSVEHNNGSVLRLENINNEWVIQEYLDPWST